MSTSARPATPIVNSTLAQYQAWTGSFNELIDTANKVLSQIDPDKLLTPRTARHYQASGVLGHGQRLGKSAQFNYHDLCTLVSTKILAASNWNLNKLSLLYSSGDQQYGCVAGSLLQELTPEDISHPSVNESFAFSSLQGNSSPLRAGSVAPPIPTEANSSVNEAHSQPLTNAQQVLADLARSVSQWSPSVSVPSNMTLPSLPASVSQSNQSRHRLSTTLGVVSHASPLLRKSRSGAPDSVVQDLCWVKAPPPPVGSVSVPSSSPIDGFPQLPVLLAKLNVLLTQQSQLTQEMESLRRQIATLQTLPGNSSSL